MIFASGEISLVVGAVSLVIALVFHWIRWLNKRDRIGKIRCKRCNHVGLPKGLLALSGIMPACERCNSQEWTAVASGEVVELPLCDDDRAPLPRS